MVSGIEVWCYPFSNSFWSTQLLLLCADGVAVNNSNTQLKLLPADQTITKVVFLAQRISFHQSKTNSQVSSWLHAAMSKLQIAEGHYVKQFIILEKTNKCTSCHWNSASAAHCVILNPWVMLQRKDTFVSPILALQGVRFISVTPPHFYNSPCTIKKEVQEQPNASLWWVILYHLKMLDSQDRIYKQCVTHCYPNCRAYNSSLRH